MTTLKVNKGFLKDIIDVPTSKSYANRALIISATTKNSPKLIDLPEATDVIYLIDALKQLGLDINYTSHTVVFRNSFPECETGPKKIEVGEGGTTARFLAGLVLLGKQEYQLILGKRLSERPWNEFINQVRSLGGHAELNGNVLSLKGPSDWPQSIEVDCSKTTQFASAFQLISHRTKTNVIPKNLVSSESYWKMTEVLQKSLSNVSEYKIPKDWSSASYPLAFGALKQKINLPNLIYDEFQADSKFIKLLKEFNTVKESNSGIVVEPTVLKKDVTIEVSDSLDLVPTLAFFLAHIEGTHKLSGIENLVHKESDRLEEVKKLLERFERNVEVKNDTLIIQGSTKVISERVSLKLPEDHRMVMVGTLFLLLHSGGDIAPIEAVSKSYPDFFNILKT